MHTPTDQLKARFNDVWVIAEQRNGHLKTVTYELLGEARRLAAARQSAVICVLLGHRVKELAKQCLARRADRVIIVDHPALGQFVDELHARVLAGLIDKYCPEIVLCGATARGRALIPRVAVITNSGLTADCTGLAIDQDGALLQTRPAFGGNIMATIRSSNHRPQMATVRPRVMSEAQPDFQWQGKIVEEPFDGAEATAWRSRVIEEVCDLVETVKLADAQFIVSGGRGVGGPKGFDLLRQFADLVGGAVGASRAAVDSGWIDYAHQVGQTGTTVQPSVYVACGISGQVQHLVGMQSADLIIAINRDASAPIMQLADYALVGDLFEVIPAICFELRQS